MIKKLIILLLFILILFPTITLADDIDYKLYSSLGVDIFSSTIDSKAFDIKNKADVRINELGFTGIYDLWKYRTNDTLGESRETWGLEGSYYLTYFKDYYFNNRKIDDARLFGAVKNYADKSLDLHYFQFGGGGAWAWQQVLFFDQFKLDTGLYLRNKESTYKNDLVNITNFYGMKKIEELKFANELSSDINMQYANDSIFHNDFYCEIPLGKYEYLSGRLGFEFDQNYYTNLSRRHYYVKLCFDY